MPLFCLLSSRPPASRPQPPASPGPGRLPLFLGPRASPLRPGAVAGPDTRGCRIRPGPPVCPPRPATPAGRSPPATQKLLRLPGTRGPKPRPAPPRPAAKTLGPEAEVGSAMPAWGRRSKAQRAEGPRGFAAGLSAVRFGAWGWSLPAGRTLPRLPLAPLCSQKPSGF